ncbi:MAG: hypothetical protein ACYTF1_07825, partial [Planctomycetota bacterium]
MTLGLPIPTRRGWALLLPVMALCVIGVLTIKAVSGDAITQIEYIIISIAAMFVAVYIGYQRLGRWSYPLFILGVLLLLFLLVGPESMVPDHK